jgi:signal transduction histidine kinase
MQTDFVAAVSHEMKTPIASVQAMAERRADGAVASPAKALDYAERIHAEMLRLGASVRNVLDASRIERVGGRAVVRPAPGEPSAVVADVAEALRPVLERRGYSFDVETSPAARPVRVDADALRSVLTNLLDNAAKFSPDRREVTLRAGPRAGGGFRIEVLDRGPGVPAGDRAKVFDRFWRGADAKRAAVPGLGLGLHVARELVLAHGGSLTVLDREGGGAAFVVDLPEAA